jgi:hypothetical protein
VVRLCCFWFFFCISTDDRVVAVVRDTVYIDGGYLWWEPGFGDGSVGPSTADGKDNEPTFISSSELT